MQAQRFPLLIPLTLLLLLASGGAIQAANAQVNLCDSRPKVDPCMPGGWWDPLLGSCQGYDGSDCFACFYGPNCKSFNASSACPVDSGAGQPVLFREYWASTGLPCDAVPADYRTPYQLLNSEQPIKPLADAIRSLHRLVGNVNAENYTIVPTYGSTQAMMAALYAMTSLHASAGGQLQVFAQAPYYASYPNQVLSTFAPVAGGVATAAWNPLADPAALSTVEILTYPNNPDGTLRRPLVSDPTRVIYDCVYYWPHYQNESSFVPLDKDIMLFSASKMTGHAGSRFGYALVKNATIAAIMREYLSFSTIGVSIDTQLRLLDIIQSLVSSFAAEAPAPAVDAGATLNPYFSFAQSRMTAHFTSLASVFESNVSAHQYTFINRLQGGAFAWIQCPPNYDCYALFEQVALLGNSGIPYGASSNFVRFSMMMPESEFAQLLGRVHQRLYKVPLPELTDDLRADLKDKAAYIGQPKLQGREQLLRSAAELQRLM